MVVFVLEYKCVCFLVLCVEYSVGEILGLLLFLHICMILFRCVVRIRDHPAD